MYRRRFTFTSSSVGVGNDAIKRTRFGAEHIWFSANIRIEVLQMKKKRAREKKNRMQTEEKTLTERKSVVSRHRLDVKLYNGTIAYEMNNTFYGMLGRMCGRPAACNWTTCKSCLLYGSSSSRNRNATTNACVRYFSFFSFLLILVSLNYLLLLFIVSRVNIVNSNNRT